MSTASRERCRQPKTIRRRRQLKNDGLLEPAETFSMLLFEPSQAVTESTGTAQVVILDTATSLLLEDRTLALPENSANGMVVAAAQATAIGVAAVTTYTILAGNTNDAFRVDASGALIVNNSAALNFETTPTFALVVEARADNGSFDVATWTVNLQNQNEPPIFSPQTRSIAENSPVSRTVGTKLVASDPDGDPLTFATTSNVFAITPAGQLLVKDSSKLDFETQTRYTLDVTVADGKGLSTGAPITVNVLNVAEGDPLAPAIAALSPASVVAGGTSFKLLVSGKNFTANSLVQWNGSNRKTVLAQGSLIALITAPDIAAASTAKVTVFEPKTGKTADGVAFPVTKGLVGIAELTVEPSGVQQSAVGQSTVFTLKWTHTSQPWRAMDEMDLRLIDGEKIPLWIRYQETRDETGKDISTVFLLNPEGTPAGSGRFGEAEVLENEAVRVDLAQASFQGSGETGMNIRVRIPVVFKAAAAQSDPYDIEMYGVDDLGGEQGPNQMGVWAITNPGIYLPFVRR